jgi:hypothetical protein
VRKCMRTAGPKLSKGCVNALIAAGEVSKSDDGGESTAPPKKHMKARQ